ncbi:MAG: peptide chain release factor N(5)-glutamine methyltransferase [Patescibacteria group bacterium]|nr:peptide chain release factor N(5)-glutamine methyltransferase [Patescibacteria group bacterium]
MNTKEALKKANGALAKTGIKEHRLDALVLLSRATDKSKEYLLAHPEFKLSPGQKAVFLRSVNQRKKKMPIAYITGNKEFFGIDFSVNAGVLIPRPETEMLVEKGIELASEHTHSAVVDIGTGSGCVIISIARALEDQLQLNNYNLFGIDISFEALETARQNSRKSGLEDDIIFLKGDLLKSFFEQQKNCIGEPLIILANLPYLSTNIYQRLPRDIRCYEPKTALISHGDDGLDLYRRFFTQIRDFRQSDTSICFEFSPEQKEELEKIINDRLPFAKTSFQKDLSGRWRIGAVLF